MIDGTPKVVPLTIDLHENLVQMPLPVRICTHPVDPLSPDLSSKHRAKSIPPKPTVSWLMSIAALVQQVLDIPERKWKANVHHDRQANDLRAAVKVLEGVRFVMERRYETALPSSSQFLLTESADEFREKTTRPNQMWQTDFTYLKVIGWGWFYLSTVLDDFSRYIVGWKLCTNMGADDVSATLDIALAASGCDSVTVLHKPRLLSDNGPCYIAGDLAKYLEKNGMDHVRGAPNHPQTQGKIERWHQTLKNRILLENYYLEGELEAAITAFVEHYNHRRYHESLGNLTPADVYFGRGPAILAEREEIKTQTIQNRRLIHQRQAA